jgi:hypothetical protein
MKDNYQQQAASFLAKHGIAFSFKLANTKRPSWDENRQCNHFIVTFRKGTRRVSFDFFDSISNFEKGIEELDAYSVLSCCSSELYCPETFEEFCNEFGYDNDSRQAEKTFKALSKFSAKLQKFFDTEEMRDDLLKIC